MKTSKLGRVTIPTNIDIIPETVEIIKKWGGDAVRDSEGTSFPKELRNINTTIYATYYTTRKDNEWAKKNADEIQQCYILTKFYTATDEHLTIDLINGLSSQMIKINDYDDIDRWWEVIDRTDNKVISPNNWKYIAETQSVEIGGAIPFHEYTVSFLAYLIWDPVYMYNTMVNNWKDSEPQLTFDVRQPKTRVFSLERLRKHLEAHQQIDVVRFTTFFHHFTLIFDKLRREKYVDWYGYSASVSPYILKQFEKEVGYTFRPEYIIDQGYYNNQYRNPSKEYLDFIAFQQREVVNLAKEMVDIVHEYGKQAMMFLGDYWIGTEPYGNYFKSIGLDAVVGSVGNGSTLRLITDIEGVKYTEGRLLPYFFPDTFYDGNKPNIEARENWLTARRAILRKPLDRIGYGGYLKLAMQFPKFIDEVERICNEFREICDNIENTKPYTVCNIAILNSWGKLRSWGSHMVRHATYSKENYSYAGIVEILAGSPFDVTFISFDDVLNNPDILDKFEVIFNIGSAYTAHSGGQYWKQEKILTTIRKYIANGGGFIGVGQPSYFEYNGHLLQLSNSLGVEQENGYTLGYNKNNWEETDHFITDEIKDKIDFGHGRYSTYALESTNVLIQKEKDVLLSTNEYEDGRCVYISGLPYSSENARLLYKSILWCSHKEDMLFNWFSTNPHIEVNVYPDRNTFSVSNNTNRTQNTTIYKERNRRFECHLKPAEICWFHMNELFF